MVSRHDFGHKKVQNHVLSWFKKRLKSYIVITTCVVIQHTVNSFHLLAKKGHTNKIGESDWDFFLFLKHPLFFVALTWLIDLRTTFFEFEGQGWLIFLRHSITRCASATLFNELKASNCSEGVLLEPLTDRSIIIKNCHRDN